MSAYTLEAMNQVRLIGQGEPELLHGTWRIDDLFETMGIQPLLGRGFRADEEKTEAKVVLIREKLWRSSLWRIRY